MIKRGREPGLATGFTPSSKRLLMSPRCAAVFNCSNSEPPEEITGKWTTEEDRVLLEAIHKSTCVRGIRWKTVEQAMADHGKRISANACRCRYGRIRNNARESTEALAAPLNDGPRESEPARYEGTKDASTQTAVCIGPRDVLSYGVRRCGWPGNIPGPATTLLEALEADSPVFNVAMSMGPVSAVDAISTVHAPIEASTAEESPSSPSTEHSYVRTTKNKSATKEGKSRDVSHAAETIAENISQLSSPRTLDESTRLNLMLALKNDVLQQSSSFHALERFIISGFIEKSSHIPEKFKNRKRGFVSRLMEKKPEDMMNVELDQICDELHEWMPELAHLCVSIMLGTERGKDSKFVAQVIPRLATIFSILFFTRNPQLSLLPRVMSMCLLEKMVKKSRKEERRHRRHEEENGRQRKVQARRERSSSNERMKRKPRDISDDEADVGAREPPVHRRTTKPSRRQRSMSNSDESVKFSKSRQTPDEESESGSPSPELVRKKRKKKNGRDSSSSIERDVRVQPASDDKFPERVRKHDRKHADPGRERRRRSRSADRNQKSRWVDDNTRHDSDRMQKQVKRERRDWSEEPESGERVDDERRQPRARDSPEHARKHKSKHARPRRERRQSGDNENRRPRDRDARRHSPHEGRRHKTHVKREHRSRSGSPSGHSRVRVKQERPSPEPRSRDLQTEEPQQKRAAGPDFKLSGNLAADTNTYKGVVIKYNQPPEARKPREKWRLYPFKGETDLPVIPLHRSSGYLIGRDRIVADIPIDHPSCSKQHAVLQFRLVDITKANGTMGRKVKPYVIDLGSTNGTYLNGKRIDAERYHELMEKDVLKFGFSSREYVLLHEKSETEEVDEEFE